MILTLLLLFLNIIAYFDELSFNSQFCMRVDTNGAIRKAVKRTFINVAEMGMCCSVNINVDVIFERKYSAAEKSEVFIRAHIYTKTRLTRSNSMSPFHFAVQRCKLFYEEYVSVFAFSRNTTGSIIKTFNFIFYFLLLKISFSCTLFYLRFELPLHILLMCY